MKILSEREISKDRKLFLVDYGNSFYAYGTEEEINSIYGTPINQCGTKEQVLENCKIVIELCTNNIKDYSKKLNFENTEIVKLLIDREDKELKALVDFSEKLQSY